MRSSLLCLIPWLLVSCGARTELPTGSTSAGGNAGEGGSGASVQVVGGAATVGGGGEGGEGGVGGVQRECDPETTQYVYLVTSDEELFSYFPETGAIEFRGQLDCPAGMQQPFSMGVDRLGTAYVGYTDGSLYKVSTLDASCEETDFEPGQQGFFTFGMGFALDSVGGSKDTLFVAEISFNGASKGLATIDPDSLLLNYIGPFSENFSDRLEMTSASDGNLYGYFLNNTGTGGWVVEIDRNDATILSSTFIEAGNGPSALAFAWWGGDFFIFTGDDNGTTITRFDPDTQTVQVVGSIGAVVVGAGVSTCAPGQ